MAAKRTGKPIQFYMPEEMKADLERVAAANGRTLKAEVLAALRRYLAAPDVVGPGTPADTPARSPAVPQDGPEDTGPAAGGKGSRKGVR